MECVFLGFNSSSNKLTAPRERRFHTLGYNFLSITCYVFAICTVHKYILESTSPNCKICEKLILLFWVEMRFWRRRPLRRYQRKNFIQIDSRNTAPLYWTFECCRITLRSQEQTEQIMKFSYLRCSENIFLVKKGYEAWRFLKFWECREDYYLIANWI